MTSNAVINIKRPVSTEHIIIKAAISYFLLFLSIDLEKPFDCMVFIVPVSRYQRYRTIVFIVQLFIIISNYIRLPLIERSSDLSFVTIIVKTLLQSVYIRLYIC